jgi:hypothetical protein
MTVNKYWRVWSETLLLAGTLIVATAGCTEALGRVYVRMGPPVPIVDARVIAPGPGYVWIPGSYAWDGSSHVWVPGRWELPPRHGRSGCPPAGCMGVADGTLSKAIGDRVLQAVSVGLG